MDSVQLGKRIKEARLSKKMTQSDVVGDFITRNMLSQIESGVAFPSIKTLEYLSQVLEIPMHQLMPAATNETDTPSINEKESASLLELLSGGKLLLEKRQYSDAIVIFTRLLENNYLADEAKALMALSLLGQASDYVKSNQLSQAAGAARRSAELGSEGIYANRDTKTRALLLLDEISDALANKFENK